MKKGKGQSFIRTVNDELSTALRPEGFYACDKIHWLGNRGVHSWQHDGGWKKEIVEMSFEKNHPDQIMIHLRLQFPTSKEEETLFDTATVGQLVGRPGSSYDIPHLAILLKITRCARKIAEDTHKALIWFKQFDTPKKCIERLESGQTVWHTTKGKPYQDSISYLSSLTK